MIGLIGQCGPFCISECAESDRMAFPSSAIVDSTDIITCGGKYGRTGIFVTGSGPVTMVARLSIGEVLYEYGVPGSAFRNLGKH